MHPLKTLLNDRAFQGTIGKHPEWEKMKFLQHGLGLMTELEHIKLVQGGMISCDGKVDAIIADYPKLLITKSTGEETSVDMGGNLRNLTFEREKQMNDGKSARIEWFPKKYTDYCARQFGLNKFRDEDRVALDTLAEMVDGRVMPNF